MTKKAKSTIVVDGNKYYLGGRKDTRSTTDWVYHHGEVPGWYIRCPPKKPRQVRVKKKKTKTQASPSVPKKVIVHEGAKYYLLAEGEICKEGDIWGDVVGGIAVKAKYYISLPVPKTSDIYRRNDAELIDGVEHFRVRSGRVRSGDMVRFDSGSYLKARGLIGRLPNAFGATAWRPVPEPCAYKAWRAQATETELRFVDVLLRKSKFYSSAQRVLVEHTDGAKETIQATLGEVLPAEAWQALKATL